MTFDDVRGWKNVLLYRLDSGYVDRSSWLAFIAVARECGCVAMADSMEKRLGAYAG